MNSAPELLLAFFALMAIGFLPMVALVSTSYLKIVVVLGLVRNAIGVQQVPPNMLLNAIALILSAFIMAPVGSAAMTGLSETGFFDKPMSTKQMSLMMESVRVPLKKFLERHTPLEDREFFVQATKLIWKDSPEFSIEDDSMLILVPAFSLRELTRAFQIGFILYLAFIAVDLVVAVVVQAFGLTMLSPTPIAIPFKLLLFVAFDGWQKLIYALVLGYQ